MDSVTSQSTSSQDFHRPPLIDENLLRKSGWAQKLLPRGRRGQARPPGVSAIPCVLLSAPNERCIPIKLTSLDAPPRHATRCGAMSRRGSRTTLAAHPWTHRCSPAAMLGATALAQVVLAIRNPLFELRLSGVFLLRFAERRFTGLLFQEPPRSTRRIFRVGRPPPTPRPTTKDQTSRRQRGCGADAPCQRGAHAPPTLEYVAECRARLGCLAPNQRATRPACLQIATRCVRATSGARPVRLQNPKNQRAAP